MSNDDNDDKDDEYKYQENFNYRAKCRPFPSDEVESSVNVLSKLLKLFRTVKVKVGSILPQDDKITSARNGT